MTVLAEPSVKVKKNTCEKYDIRVSKMGGWAKITLCEEDGSVGIISDYGNWGYLWSHHGCESLKHFLLQVGKHYASEKFTGGKKEYNHERTIKHIKQHIIEFRREGSYKKKDAREMFDALDWVENEHEIYNDGVLSEHIPDIYEFFSSDPDRQFDMFFDRLWVVFLDYIKEEVKNCEVND